MNVFKYKEAELLEAKDYLLNHYLVVGSPVNPSEEECKKHNAVMDIAIECINKAIPRNPKAYEVHIKQDVEICPICHSIVRNSEYISAFCPDCGQRIDWSENEDNSDCDSSHSGKSDSGV